MTIEWYKHIFHVSGDLLNHQAIQQSKQSGVYQVVHVPSLSGEPYIFSLIDDGENAILSYAEQNFILSRSKRSKASNIWLEQVENALKGNGELPEEMPDCITIARTSVLLTTSQRQWFLQRMAEFECSNIQDCGEQEQTNPLQSSRGEPYYLYGQYFTPTKGFQSFYDWTNNRQTHCKFYLDTFYYLALSAFEDTGILHHLIGLNQFIDISPAYQKQHGELLTSILTSTTEVNPLTTQSIAFDRAADYYDDTRGFALGVDQSATIATIVRAGNLTEDSRILEIGVGTGRIALPLSKHVSAIHGIDLSRPMMLRLRSKQSDEPIYLVQGDATQLPYPDHSFDAAVGVHILHLIPNWQGVLAELIRVLNPDAPFIQCWAKSDDIFKSLWDALRSVTPDTEAADVGLGWDKNESTLLDLGWHIGNTETFDFTYKRSPGNFIQQLENRVWSRTWRLSNDSLAAGLAAVKAVVARDYPDPAVLIPVHEQFVAKAYFPPQSG